MKSSKSEVIITGSDFLFLSPILARVIKASQRMEFRFMVIGAVARDILFKEVYKCGLSLRATKDVDVAILIENWERFDLIIDEMINNEGFVSKGVPHRLYYNRMALDLIPFGSTLMRRFIHELHEGHEFGLLTDYTDSTDKKEKDRGMRGKCVVLDDSEPPRAPKPPRILTTDYTDFTD